MQLATEGSPRSLWRQYSWSTGQNVVGESRNELNWSPYYQPRVHLQWLHQQVESPWSHGLLVLFLVALHSRPSLALLADARPRPWHGRDLQGAQISGRNLWNYLEVSIARNFDSRLWLWLGSSPTVHHSIVLILNVVPPWTPHCRVTRRNGEKEGKKNKGDMKHVLHALYCFRVYCECVSMILCDQYHDLTYWRRFSSVHTFLARQVLLQWDAWDCKISFIFTFLIRFLHFK